MGFWSEDLIFLTVNFMICNHSSCLAKDAYLHIYNSDKKKANRQTVDIQDLL